MMTRGAADVTTTGVGGALGEAMITGGAANAGGTEAAHEPVSTQPSRQASERQ